jgi:hypothetical protein
LEILTGRNELEDLCIDGKIKIIIKIEWLLKIEWKDVDWIHPAQERNQ